MMLVLLPPSRCRWFRHRLYIRLACNRRFFTRRQLDKKEGDVRCSLYLLFIIAIYWCSTSDQCGRYRSSIITSIISLFSPHLNRDSWIMNHAMVSLHIFSIDQMKLVLRVNILYSTTTHHSVTLTHSICFECDDFTTRTSLPTSTFRFQLSERTQRLIRLFYWCMFFFRLLIHSKCSWWFAIINNRIFYRPTQKLCVTLVVNCTLPWGSIFRVAACNFLLRFIETPLQPVSNGCTGFWMRCDVADQRHWQHIFCTFFSYEFSHTDRFSWMVIKLLTNSLWYLRWNLNIGKWIKLHIWHLSLLTWQRRGLSREPYLYPTDEQIIILSLNEFPNLYPTFTNDFSLLLSLPL